MKKIWMLIALVFSVATMSACNNNENTELEEVKIIAPNGTPYIALGGLLDEENITIDAVNGADNLRAALVSGSHDIVVAPVNLGAQLYNKGNSKFKLAAVVTMNNAYIVTNSENKLDSMDDLENQKVIAFGQTGIPGSVLTELYNKNSKLSLDNVNFAQASSAAVYSLFVGGTSEAKYALMSQPEIAKLKLNNNMDVKTLDLCEILGIDVPQACIYVNPESLVLESVNRVLELIENNINYLNNNVDSYVEEIIVADRIYEATGKEVLKSSLPNMDIVYKTGVSYKSQIEGVLTILKVALPDDAFYYQK